MPPPQCTRPEQAPLSLPSTPHTHLVVGGPPARARRGHYEPSRVRFRPQSTLGRVRIRTLYENEKPPMTQDTGQVQKEECRREASLCSSSRPRRLRCERVPCSDAPDSIPPLPEGDHTRLDACGTGIHLLARPRKRLPGPLGPSVSALAGANRTNSDGHMAHPMDHSRFSAALPAHGNLRGSALICFSCLSLTQPPFLSPFPSASLMPGQFFPPPRFSDHRRLTLPHAARPGSVASILPNPAVTSKIFGTVPITEGEWDHHPFPLHGCRGSRGGKRGAE